MTVELGLITPPVGMNVFFINSITSDVGIVSIFKGVLPFVLTHILRLLILAALPSIVLLLPRMLG
jgi:C4-dicarboxylate transporter, DctM subunit